MAVGFGDKEILEAPEAKAVLSRGKKGLQRPPAKEVLVEPDLSADVAVVEIPGALFDDAKDEAEKRGGSVQAFIAMCIRSKLLPDTGNGLCSACGCEPAVGHAYNCPYA